MLTNTNNKLWVAGSAILVVVLLAMGWFLGVSPKLDSAHAADQQSTEVDAQNRVHEQELVKIKKQFEQLPQLRQQLSVLRQAVPADDELSTFLGELHGLEQANQVSLTSFTSGDGQPYTPVKDSTIKTVSTTNPLVTPDNFVAIPVKLDVTGDQAALMNFIQGLQTGERLFLVTDLDLKQQKDPKGQKGPTQSEETITGFVYVLLDETSQPKPVKLADKTAKPKK